jgi:hypothetical protein
VANELLVLRRTIVKDAAARLMEQRAYRLHQPGIHSHFTGYLGILFAGAQGSSATVGEIRRFLDLFFCPSNGTSQKPWWVPWARTGDRWLNRNASGSYAPSSPRGAGGVEEAALFKVAQLVESNGEQVFKLRTDHGRLARQELLCSETTGSL